MLWADLGVPLLGSNSLALLTACDEWLCGFKEAARPARPECLVKLIGILVGIATSVALETSKTLCRRSATATGN